MILRNISPPDPSVYPLMAFILIHFQLLPLSPREAFLVHRYFLFSLMTFRLLFTLSRYCYMLMIPNATTQLVSSQTRWIFKQIWIHRLNEVRITFHLIRSNHFSFVSLSTHPISPPPIALMVNYLVILETAVVI